MDTAPLVMDEIDAGAEFLKRLNSYRAVKAGCWLREAENAERYLYAALDGLTDENSDVAYGEVLRIVGEMKGRYIDPFRVKLIGMDHLSWFSLNWKKRWIELQTEWREHTISPRAL